MRPITEPRIALVLGAGGITGGAYERGLLQALAGRRGGAPARARPSIGTGAGSWIAPCPAAGRTTPQFRPAGGPPAPQGGLARRTGRRLANTVLGDVSGLYTPDLRVPRISPLWWLRPTDFLAESGLFSNEGMVRRLRAALPEEVLAEWPHSALRIVAFDTRRLRREVFGKPGAPRATLLEAVTASSAIPGVFRPVVIDGVPYLDGGIASTTNLDLADEFAADVDLVLCIAPMAGERVGGLPPADPAIYGYALTEGLAWVARLQVEREAARLRARHPALEVLIFRPDEEDRRVMGVNAMDGRERAPVLRQAYASGLRLLDRDDVRQTLARHGLAVGGRQSAVGNKPIPPTPVPHGKRETERGNMSPPEREGDRGSASPD